MRRERAKPPVINACDTCRKRKVKCDRRRPDCSACRHYGSICSYRPQHQTIIQIGEDGPARDLAQLLHELPDQEVERLFQEYFARRQVALGRPKQISEYDVLRCLLPPTQNSVEFELTIRHTIAYPTLIPLQVSDLSFESLLGPHRITREHAAGEWSSFKCLGHLNDGARAEGGLSEFASVPLFSNRLRDIDFKLWTKVPIENQLAIRVISFYFEVDYPIVPVFNADLFIEDLARGRRWFSSELLVNSLLCWACQAYTPFDASMPSRSVAFLNEATRVLGRETHRNTLTTVAALQILCMSTICLGLHDDAIIYLREGVKIGKRMGLFGAHSEKESASTWLADHQDWRRAASYTAWGVFNWVVLHGTHYNLTEIETAPMLPRPGSVPIPPEKLAETTAKVSQHTQLFDAMCELRVIGNDILWQYYGDTIKGIPKHITVEVAEAAYRRLLSWAETLPLELIRSEQSTHGVMMMHIYLHCMIVDTFRPFLGPRWRSYPLRTFATPRATPKAIHAASINQLKRLLLVYRLQCKLGLFSCLCHTPILYVVNAMFHEASTAVSSGKIVTGVEWQFYVDLCLTGYQSLFESFRAFGTAAKGMLAVALRHGIIDACRAEHGLSELQELGSKYDEIKDLDNARVNAGGWIVDQDLGMTDPWAAAGGSLAEEISQKLKIDDDVPTQE